MEYDKVDGGIDILGKPTDCPLQADEGGRIMTYGDIYEEFCKKFPDVNVRDFRPASPLYIPQLLEGISNAIIVWLTDGSKVIYIAESEG